MPLARSGQTRTSMDYGTSTEPPEVEPCGEKYPHMADPAECSGVCRVDGRAGTIGGERTRQSGPKQGGSHVYQWWPAGPDSHHHPARPDLLGTAGQSDNG